MSTNSDMKKSKTAETPGEQQGARTPYARRVVITVLIALGIVTVAYFLWRATAVLLQAFAGVLLAIFLSALSDWVSRRTRLSRGWSLAVVVAGLLLIAGGFGYFLWSQLADQISELIESLPRSFERIRGVLLKYPWGKYLIENAPEATDGMVRAGQFSRVTGFVSGVAGALETAVVVLIVGIFGAAEPSLYRTGFLRLFPPANRGRVDEALKAVTFNLRQWLVGQAALMVILAATTTAGLWLIGVPLALALGMITGALELLPYIGAWASAVPALLIALLKGPDYLAYAALLYLALHLLEGYVLLPLIQRSAVHLPPALTLVAQALMGNLFGILGLFVAAPLTVVAMVLLQMLYVEDTLGDESVDVPGEPERPEPANAQTQ